MTRAEARMFRFQELMREFLDSQQQVMAALLANQPVLPPVDGFEESSLEADVDPRINQALPPRFALRVHEAHASQAAGLARGVILITADGLGIAHCLATLLVSKDQPVVVMTSAGRERATSSTALPVDFSSQEDVERAVAEVRAAHGSVVALVHLLSLRPGDENPLDPAVVEGAVADARSLFLLVKVLRADLENAARNGGGALIGVSGLGGAFASDPVYRPATFSPGEGAVTGLLKTVAVELPTVRVRTVDLDVLSEVPTLADHLAVELYAADEMAEVGYVDGRRVALRPCARRAVSSGACVQPASDWVWLVTGGARGITADICLELAARTQPTLVLVGQSAEPAAIEEGPTAGVDAPADLKAILLQQLKADSGVVTPAMVEEAYRRLQRDREIRTNLAAFAETGARVHYRSLDVRNAAALESLVVDVYRTYGRIDGVIHGAGIIEDKLIKDKTAESFDRVFRTKVISAFAFARTLQLDSLRALVLFSSVAGRFGNRGQGDYGAANEVINKLAIYLSGRSAARVVALNWGPWDKRGMVSQEIKNEFARRGIQLIAPDEGRATFFEELTASAGDVEVVVGGGPWNETVIDEPETVALPLMVHAVATHALDRHVDVVRPLDTAIDRYLLDHCLDGKPVLPLAVATELMVEAVQQAHPDEAVVAVERCRLLRGVVLEDGPLLLRVTSQHAGPRSRPDGRISVDVELRVDGDSAGQRYQATIVLGDAREQPLIREARALHPFSLSASDCYRKWLFHGPCFQRISRIGRHDLGLRVALANVHQNRCVYGVDRPAWVIDPFMLDVPPQLGVLWSRASDDSTALPSGFECFELFGTSSEEPAVCDFIVRESGAGATFVADAFFLTRTGAVSAMLTGLECVRMRRLNDLAGQTVSKSRVSVSL